LELSRGLGSSRTDTGPPIRSDIRRSDARFRCPNSDGNCLRSHELWDSRTRASMRLLGTGRPRTNERAFTQSDRCCRHSRLTQSRWSFPQQPMSRDWILPCQIRRPCHHDAWPSSVSISALALLEFVRRELFECGRCRVLSGAGHGVCGLWLPGWLEGCSAPTWSIIRLIT
jgi:hypothetical protein